MSVDCGTCAALARTECRCEHGREAKAQRERYRGLERAASRFYLRAGVVIDPCLLEGTDADDSVTAGESAGPVTWR